MEDELIPHLNKANGLIGFITREQAVAIGDNWQELEAVEVPLSAPPIVETHDSEPADVETPSTLEGGIG